MRKYLIPVLLTVLTTASCTRGKSDDVEVIPRPSEVAVSDNYCTICSLSNISTPEALTQEAASLVAGLEEIGGCDLTIKEGKGDIKLSVDNALSKEEYILKVRKHGISITGGSAAGVFYGIQTVLQEARAYEGKVKTGIIKDAPRYGWRGYMLDESRHFFGEAQVKQILDVMACYKLNKFHWHLTDAPGWRIEIKAYPLLTEVGGIGCYSDAEAPAEFYTQDQICDIVAYAAARHIEIIPEIDMPGHASSANRAYPENAVGEAGSFTYNPGKECVYEFLENVLKEVVDMFPSEYIHTGGDEVSMGSKTWATDPFIMDLMKKEGFGTPLEAEAYFNKRMGTIVNKLGRKVFTWDDTLELGIENPGYRNLTWWRQERMDHLYRGLKEGYGMVLCPRLPLYYDFIQHPDHQSGRVWRNDRVDGIVTLEHVYAYPESLFAKWEDADADKSNIMGIQANLWSEWVKTDERMQYMTYPRICALAESAWTKAELKDYKDFSVRMEQAYKFFDGLGVYYYDHRDPGHHPEVLQ